MYLIVSIDTEEDMPNWRPEFPPTVGNIFELPKLHALFQKYGVHPTYLVDWPVLMDDPSLSIIKRLASEGGCEIGAHVHSWNTPPITDEEYAGKATYLSSLEPRIQYEKLKNFTELFEQRLGFCPVSYRAGRYGFDQHGAEILMNLGYEVDTSVAPLMDFRDQGGPTFRLHDAKPFVIRLSRDRNSLLEVPVTICLVHRFFRKFETLYFLFPEWTRLRGVLHKLNLARLIWLRPSTYTFSEMKQLADYAMDKLDCHILVLMFHSSEVHPGSSPYNRTKSDVQAFLYRLEHILRYLIKDRGLQGITLREYAQLVHRTKIPLPSRKI